MFTEWWSQLKTDIANSVVFTQTRKAMEALWDDITKFWKVDLANLLLEYYNMLSDDHKIVADLFNNIFQTIGQWLNETVNYIITHPAVLDTLNFFSRLYKKVSKKQF